MAEGTYEFEVMRAELLGVQPPSIADFEANKKERMSAEQEEIETEEAKELDCQDEKLASGSGKLDDLNQILSITQQKLHKFKGVCGSLTNLLRLKSDSKNNSTDALNHPAAAGEAGASSSKDPDLTVNDEIAALEQMEAQEKMTTGGQARATKLDLDKKLTSHLDKLDSLINKAEKAEISMEKQNKQMKGFLR